MSWFDIIISLVLLGAFISGMRKGLTMQLAGLAAIILGAIFAGKVADILLPLILKSINISVNTAGVISYILAFVVIVFGIKFIGKMIQSLFEALHINFLNKIMGAVVGTISASIVLSILVNLAVLLDPEEEVITSKLKSDTFFYSKIQIVVPSIVPYLKNKTWDKYIPEQFKQEDEEHEDTDEANRTLLSKN